jgi:poly(3-hydroxybutyrate) depolymerase
MNGRTAPQLRAIAPIIGLPHAGDLRPPGRSDGLPVLLVTGQQDPVVPPGHWDDVSSTTTSNDQDRFRYTGATAILKAWAAADGCAPRTTEIRTAIAAHDADCRTYCPRNGERMPRVLDCRAPMTHDYGLDWSWKLALDFFDAQ